MDFTKLTTYLEQRDSNLIPDCRLVVFQDHACLYDRSFSRADVAPSEQNKDMYFLFSASKVITCTAALRLIEDGKLGMDDPVSKYLPEFAELYKWENGNVVPVKNVLTVRHLFSMQGGLTYDLGHPEIQKIKADTNNQATTRDIMRGIAKMPLSFEPGENFQYSLCHDVLAAVVEVASGKRFSEYLHEVIFDPLGMKDITMRPTPDVMARMKQQYAVDGFSLKAVKKEATCPYILSDRYESGGAGMIATLEDYILFVDTMACGTSKDGYRILKPETIKLMQTNQLEGKSLQTYRVACMRKEGHGYGCGVRTVIDPTAAFSKGPVGEFGWDGAAGAYCLIDPENHVSLYFAMHVLNCGYAYQNMHHAIRNHVYEAIKG